MFTLLNLLLVCVSTVVGTTVLKGKYGQNHKVYRNQAFFDKSYVSCSYANICKRTISNKKK